MKLTREKYCKPRGFGRILFVLLLFVISVCFIWLVQRRTCNGHNRTKAVAHAKQVYIGLMEFEEEHGMKPGQQIAVGGKLLSARAETANDCFRQMLQGLEMVRTEAIFYAPSPISQYPDNDIGIEPLFSNACGKGEVGFLYVDNPDAENEVPLLAAPLRNTSGVFDLKTYKGKAVILYSDGSVKSHEIDEDTGKVIVEINGKRVDLLSSDNPYFKSPPNIKYPVPK